MVDYEVIPTTSEGVEVEEGSPPEEHPSFDNEADNEDVVKAFAQEASTKLQQYVDDRDPYDEEDEGVWPVADYMYAAGRDASMRATKSDDETLADTGSTIFHRECRTIASQNVAILFSREDPAQFLPLRAGSSFKDDTDAETQAKQQNLLMRYTMKKDGFAKKATDFLNLLARYGNQPLMMRWNYETGTRKFRKVERDESGEIKSYTHSERKVVVHNEPSLQVTPIEMFYIDPHCGSDIQKQQCIIIPSQEDRCVLWGLQRDGEIKNLEKVTQQHEWQGDDYYGSHQDHQDHRLTDGDTDDTRTGLIERFDVWMKAPIGKNGDKYEWDVKKYEPQWWWGIFAGRLNSSCTGDDPGLVCLCLRRNYDPDDEFPGYLAHHQPDNADSAYHLSPSQVIETLYDQITTKQNLAIDNDTLMNRRPLIVKRGNVFTKNLTYAADAVWVTENGKEDIQEADVKPVAGDTIGMIQYLATEADRALGTDKPIVGEAMGGRTSATEAQNIFEQASKPHLMLVRYVLEPFLTWYYKKCKAYWELYSLKDQVLEITGVDGIQEIKPAELYGDYEVLVDVVDRFIDDAMAQSNLNFLIQALPNLPEPQNTNWKALKKDIFEVYKIGPNPSKYINDGPSRDAERLAIHENGILIEGQAWDDVDQMDDHSAHLSIHESRRFAFNGIEDVVIQQEGNPHYFKWIDDHIAKHKMLQQQQAAQSQQQAPMESPNQSQTPGAMVGDQISAQLGAVAP